MSITIENISLQQAFTPTNEFYSLVLDSLEDYAILTTDTNLLINSWNSGAEKIFQYSADEALGKHFELIFTEEDRQNGTPLSESQLALSSGRAKDKRWHIRKDGSLFFASGLVFPLKGTEGKLIGFVKILRNVTEHKLAEEAIAKYLKELEELDTHKDKILSVLSHDLRNPLGSIITAAMFLQLQYDTMAPGEIKGVLGMLEKSSQGMLNMLDNLLEWARIKYASDIFKPAEVDVNDSVQEVLNLLYESAFNKTIEIHNRVEENTIVWADKKMLSAIFRNLISNAIKYTGIQGEITISAVRKGGMILVSVGDTGSGMSEEVCNKLFIPQIESLSEPRCPEKGAGIGLLLVKEFLDKIGGTIWVESEPGNGSTFYFTLPVS